MNRFFLHIALLLCALQMHANDSIDDADPRSFGYAIRTGLISAFAMRLYRQNKRKVLGITIAFDFAFPFGQRFTIPRRRRFSIPFGQQFTFAVPFGQRTLFPYIQNGRITYPPERVMVNSKFLKKDIDYYKDLLSHERAHVYQQKIMGRFNFYLRTLYEYVISPGYWNDPYNNPKCLEYWADMYMKLSR
ncbi:MAG: hypothetical protein II950_04210 [Prevotella sp.]|nr:hypothetical protein [Prevotella sp.]